MPPQVAALLLVDALDDDAPPPLLDALPPLDVLDVLEPTVAPL